MTIEATLVFLIKDHEILLIKKKRGFGANKYNGVGGKVQQGERLEDAARREVLEEVGVKVGKLQYRGVLKFYSVQREPDWIVHVFLTKDFTGSPHPSPEADPKWFKISEIPYEEMWEDDRYWLPLVLNGYLVEAEFWFNENYTKLLKWNIKAERF